MRTLQRNGDSFLNPYRTDNAMKRLKILASVYACSPYHGSEPGIGWNFVKSIATNHDLWVITEKYEFQEQIETYLDAHPDLRDRMTVYYIPKKQHPTLRKIWPPSYYWFYRRWQEKALRLSRSLCKEVSFDLVHHVTMSGFREPGYLWKLNLPFVWGPVGGMIQFPWRFLTRVGIRGGMYYLSRNVINAYQMRFSARPRKAARRAAGGLIAATGEIQEKMFRFWGVQSRIICEMGQTDIIPRDHARRETGSPILLAWSARHSSGKALPILLHALSQLSGPVKWHLNVFGIGKRTDAWKKLSQRLHIDKNCTWHGWLPKDNAVSLMHRAHAFVVTSLKDLTSAVILEAISQGLPVICLDHCGFSDVITEECGIKIPVTTPQRASIGIAGAIEYLWNDETYRRRLAQGALRRARDYAWEKKMEILNTVYSAAIAHHDIRTPHRSLRHTLSGPIPDDPAGALE